MTYARDAEILSQKMKRKRPDAAIRYSTLCRGAVQYLIDEFTVRKNNNKVLTDKLKVLEDKAEKVEAFNNKVLTDKIKVLEDKSEKVETAVSNLARSDRTRLLHPKLSTSKGDRIHQLTAQTLPHL